MLDRINTVPLSGKDHIELRLNEYFTYSPNFRFSLKNSVTGQWGWGIVDKESLYMFTLEAAKSSSISDNIAFYSYVDSMSIDEFVLRSIKTWETGRESDEPEMYTLLKIALFQTSVGLTPYYQDPDLSQVVRNALGNL